MSSDTNSTMGNGDPVIQDVIQARRFELIGADGKVAAVLGVIDKHPLDGDLASGGNLGLAILDASGRPQIRLCGRHPDGLASMEGLTIYLSDGTVRVSINSGTGVGGLLVEAGGQGGLSLGSFSGAAPIMRIFQGPVEKTLFLLTPENLQFSDANDVVKFKAPS